jgi:hypothetical protein
MGVEEGAAVDQELEIPIADTTDTEYVLQVRPSLKLRESCRACN